MPSKKLVPHTCIHKATDHLHDHFIEDKRHNHQYGHPDFKIYHEAYQKLLDKYAHCKETTLRLTYWGFECDLNHL